MRPLVVFDIECYQNFFLVMFLDLQVNTATHYFMFGDNQALPVKDIMRTMAKYTLIGFNSKRYDIPMLLYVLKGATCAQLKVASDDIIKNNRTPWDFEARYDTVTPDYLDTTDLFDVAPGMASLKVYGGRMHVKTLQDLPFEEDTVILDHQVPRIIDYCRNDLDITRALYEELKPQIVMREQMGADVGIDLRSKSDAQIAEAVIRQGVEKLTERKIYRPDIQPGATYNYRPPSWLCFDDPRLKELVHEIATTEFKVGHTGGVDLPETLSKKKIQVGSAWYKMGIGGLHSIESKRSIHGHLVDIDVASYYPRIILNERYYPRHMGRAFLEVYEGIVNRRLKAKAEGDKVRAEGLKVTINGSFGKLGNKWSVMYSPDLLIHVTLTGQLALMMLIEMLENDGFKVLSANTDGIMVDQFPYGDVSNIVGAWELITGFETEKVNYSSLHNRDVNNYVAVDPFGETKVKGVYAEVGSTGKSRLSKNPVNMVCNDAIIDYLAMARPVEETIRACHDIRRFVTVRKVTGGAYFEGAYLGKAIRWYYGQNRAGFIHNKHGDKVPRTDSAVPLMTLPDRMPADVDRDWYVQEAKDMLKDMGVAI